CNTWITNKLLRLQRCLGKFIPLLQIEKCHIRSDPDTQMLRLKNALSTCYLDRGSLFGHQEVAKDTHAEVRISLNKRLFLRPVVPCIQCVNDPEHLVTPLGPH